MAISTLPLVAVFLGAYALYKLWDTSRRHRVPRGLKPLPGPKGMERQPLAGTRSAMNPEYHHRVY